MRRLTVCRATLAVSLSLGFGLGLAACGGKSAPPAPAPFRPAPQPVVKEAPPEDTTPKDCAPSDPSNSKPALSYAERAIPLGESTAQQGVAKLESAKKASDARTYESELKEAVDLLVAALEADPYNVHATYNLAAAYARIERTQCVVNLLSRLMDMRKHASKQVDVDKKLDLLLGRNGKRADADFDAVRTDDRFREVLRGL